MINLKSAFPFFESFTQEYFLYKNYYHKYRSHLFAIKDEKQLVTLLEEIEYKEGKNYCYRILARKSYFYQELERKLSQRLFQKKIVLCLLDEMLHYRFLDDDRQWENAILGYKNRGYGPNLIALKLSQKLSSFIDPQKIQQNYAIEEQLVTIRKYMIKKKWDIRNWKEKEKAKKFFLSKGFFLETIEQFFSSYSR